MLCVCAFVCLGEWELVVLSYSLCSHSLSLYLFLLSKQQQQNTTTEQQLQKNLSVLCCVPISPPHTTHTSPTSSEIPHNRPPILCAHILALARIISHSRRRGWKSAAFAVSHSRHGGVDPFKSITHRHFVCAAADVEHGRSAFCKINTEKHARIHCAQGTSVSKWKLYEHAARHAEICVCTLFA